MEKPFCPTCEKEFDTDIKFCPFDATGLIYRSEDSMVGQIFDGRYQILHKLGEGGMGAVYKARQVSTGKLVAIKVISMSLAGDADTLKRFQREVKLQSQLEHPNIVTVIDFSQTSEGQYFFVMGFVEGRSLRMMILEDGPLASKPFLDLAIQMLDALEYAHNKKIVHRDLKADNMVVVKLPHQQIVKILDFGLAKAFQEEGGHSQQDTMLTQQGRILGTPAYMSPEQARGEIDKIGPPSDLYSLGIIFYQMLSGKLPFLSDTPWGIMHKIMCEDPAPLRRVNPDVPEWIDSIIMRCMEKDIADRYPSANAVKLEFARETVGELSQVTGGYSPDGDFVNLVTAPPPVPKIPPVPPVVDSQKTQISDPVIQIKDDEPKKSGALPVIAALFLIGALGLGYFFFAGGQETPVEVAKVETEPAVDVAPVGDETGEPQTEEADPVTPDDEKTGMVATGAKTPEPTEKATPAPEERPTVEEAPVEVAKSPEPAQKSVTVTKVPVDKPADTTKPVPVEKEVKVATLKPAKKAPAKIKKPTGPTVLFRGGADRSGVFNDPGVKELKGVKWRFFTDDWIFSSPVVSNGTVYFGSDDRSFYAVDAKSGEEKWKFDTGGPIQCSPAIIYGNALFGSADGYMYAVNMKTGRQVWKFKTGGDIFSSPSVSGRNVYFGSADGNVYALDALTGAKKWTRKTRGKIDSSPAVDDGLVFVGSHDEHMYALDSKTGTMKWKFKTGDSIGSSPLVSGQAVYFGSDDGNIYALAKGDGSLRWKVKTDSWVRSSPAMSGATVVAGSKDGFLYAVDVETGDIKWRFETGEAILSSPAVAGAIIYFGSEDGNLYAVDANTGGQKWKYATSDGGVFSSPFVSNSTVYFGGQDDTFYALH